VATSRSSRSSESPAWLRAVYQRRRHRTVRLVELSIAALTRVGERASLAAIARTSVKGQRELPDGGREISPLAVPSGGHEISPDKP
jgi:hypothetical protein